jgi:outer membrane protein assembly factor BamB
VFVTEQSNELKSFDSESGQLIWTQNGLKKRILTGPTTISRYVAVADDEGYVHLTSQLNGDIVGRIRLRPSPIHMTIPNQTQMTHWQKIRGKDFGIRSRMIATDNGLLVYTNVGDLFLLSIHDN